MKDCNVKRRGAPMCVPKHMGRHIGLPLQDKVARIST